MSEQSKKDPYHLGNSFMFPPEVMNDIHIKAELGRYRMRGFSLFKKIPTWDDLTFMPGTLTRFVIEGYRYSNRRRRRNGPSICCESHHIPGRRSDALERPPIGPDR